jgi:16S rRNA (adenine1518-N6/adenine1519-N6)-dimethyltransferase
MIYTNTQELVALLKRENLWAQKQLGQNFLVNMQALNKIIEAAELTKQDNVLEIGPGLGILTEQLSLHANKVTAIELDRSIIPVLQKNLHGTNNVQIIHQDALKIELPTQPYKLVANIPYYITSPILNHFLQPQTTNEQRPNLIVLLVQKEVAQKICVKDGDHTMLSLEVQAFGKPSIACHVSKNSFFPQPKVDSSILKIQTYPNPKINNIPIFFQLIKAAFHQRRKTLSNSFQNGLQLGPEKTKKIFDLSGIEPTKRPQNISLEEWNALCQAYEKIEKRTK